MSRPVASVGVVIVTFNSQGEIGSCLESVAPASSRPVDVVVVDNASTDETASIVRNSLPGATLIRNTTNRYYAAASNQALRQVGGACVLLLNPDTVLPVGGIDALRTFLEEHPGAAAVAPQLIGPDGRRQHSLRELPGLDTLWYDLTGLALVFPRSRRFGRWRMGDFDGRSARVVDQPMASCLLIRREVLAEVGLFDERYPMFFNDVDWCARVAAAGWSIYYTPDVRVRHLAGASINRHKVKMIWMGHAAYLKYLHRLYARRPLIRALVWMSVPFVFVGALLRTVWWGGVRRIVGG